MNTLNHLTTPLQEAALSESTPSHGATRLDSEARSAISTNEAAFHLGRKPQTLRKWACYEDGPMRPVRINGRLAWRVADLMRVLNEGSAK